jgi:hypothetical protein
MTTPNKQEIIQKAIELWKSDQVKAGCVQLAEINPEIEELRESGYIASAQSELMRDGYRSQIENKDFYEMKENLAKNEKIEGLPLDLAECRKSNILVSGTNQQGKSLTAMAISDLLKRQGWQIIAFDNSNVWRWKSNIANVYDVNENFECCLSTSESAIFNTSLLTSEQQRDFVEVVLRNIWNLRIKLKLDTWLLLVFEEFQLYAKNVRGKLSQNLLRLMSVGANMKTRCLGVTVDIALIDPLFIRLCGQRYHFRLGIESGAKARFKAYYGKEMLEKALALDVGECLYVCRDKTQLAKIPLFKKAVPNNEPYFKMSVVMEQ